MWMPPQCTNALLLLSTMVKKKLRELRLLVGNYAEGKIGSAAVPRSLYKKSNIFFELRS